MTTTETGRSHPADAPADEPRRPSLARAAFYAATAGVLLWAVMIVPLPLVEFVPGKPTSIPDLVEIEGIETTDIDGDAALLTVVLRQPTTLGAVSAALNRDRRMDLRANVFPPDIDESEYFAGERDRFRAAFEVAVAVGARQAGIEASIDTAARVAGVLREGPAEGHLEVGDLVVRYEDEQVETAEQLAELTADGDAGDRVEVAVVRGGQEVTAEIELGQVRGMDRPGLGVRIETVPGDLLVPFEAALAEDTRIGGPSAGMMIALTVYDLLSEEDLIDGRTVVGTGAIDADGIVGNVGGVPEKLLAARDYGADIVLLPAGLYRELRDDIPPGLEVVPVRTLEEAIEALRG